MNLLYDQIFKNPNVKFGDIFAMHTMAELYAISAIVETFKPERVVEYGTAMGGVTRLLGRHAYVQDAGMKILTIEDGTYASMNNYEKHRDLINQPALPISFLIGNEYWEETYQQVQLFVKGFKTLYYCDGGNKPLEMKSCARLLEQEDLLLVHDFELGDKEGITLPPLFAEVGEVTRRQVQRVMDSEGLEVVLEDFLGPYDKNWPERPTRILALKKKKVEVTSGVSDTCERSCTE